MKNSLLAPLILGGVVLVAVGAYASTRTDLNPWQDYADVISVAPAFDLKQTARQDCNGETVVEQSCETVYDNEKVPAGYDVTYVLDGEQNVVRMDHNPGNRIRLENGEVDLS